VKAVAMSNKALRRESCGPALAKNSVAPAARDNPARGQSFILGAPMVTTLPQTILVKRCVTQAPLLYASILPYV
jgi:hypothetical protein